MQVEIENLSPYERKISVKIPADLVSREIEATYRSLNQKIRLKGFRPGKIPQSIMSRLYKTQVEEEVAAKLISNSLPTVVKDHQLVPVSEPNLLSQGFTAEKGFTYSVSLEVKPEIMVQNYLGVELEVPSVVVSEEEVAAELKRLQEAHAQLKPLEDLRPIQKNDLVLLDFEGTLEGKPIEGWKVLNHLVEVGSGSLIADLDEKLIGLRVNEEKDVLLTLPADYVQNELAGKEISVHLKVKEIKEKILPNLDDEFAKDIGEYQTLAELKEHLRRSIGERKKNRARQMAKEKILQILIERNPLTVPKSMVERQVQDFLERAERQFARQGRKIEISGAEGKRLREEFLPLAEKEVRGSLILEKIADLEKISVSEEDINVSLEKLAKRLNQRVEAVKNFYQQRNLMDELRHKILEEKTLDFLLENAKIKENPAIPFNLKEESNRGDEE